MTVGVPGAGSRTGLMVGTGAASGTSGRRLVLRRIVLSPVILLGVVFTVFAMVDLSPKDPAYATLGQYASLEMRERFAEQHGLNDPLLVRFGRFLADLARLDLGESVTRSGSVSELMARALPISFQLMVLSVLFAVVFALLFGVLAAWREGRTTDRAISAAAAVVQAAPDFWIGLLFIQLFALALGLLPSGGYTPLTAGFVPWLSSMVGPAAVLGLGIMAGLTRIIRASMADELAKDYVITARGGGLSWPVVLFRNVLRNALVTPITVLGMVVGSLMSGAVLIETVFNLPGMGSLLISGVNTGDLGIVRGVTIVAAVAFLVANLIVDLLYYALSPRSAEASPQ